MIQTDARGRAVGFSHHDGALEGISAQSGLMAVRLSLRSSRGEPHAVLLSGVSAFRVDSFREGNIIHAIRWHSIAEARRLAELADMVRDRLGLDVGTLPTDAFVFLLEPSYGAEVIAVCRDAEVT